MTNKGKYYIIIASYEADFPPLAQQINQQTKISTIPFIHSTKVDNEG